jgi:DNA-binding NarL/FixJ family response regulator
LSRILVVEDHVLVREGLVATLHRLDGNIEVFQAGDAESAMHVLADVADLDLILIDLMLPGMNGFSFLGVLRKRFPSVPVMVVSALDDATAVQRAMRLGAAAFVPKSFSGDELLSAVRLVCEGGEYFPPVLSPFNPSARRRSGLGRDVTGGYGLTGAQGRVLSLLAAGKSNREIAELLGVTEGTVKVHLSAIYRALNVTSRSQALVLITRSGRTP